ncbi:tigger transposable element-derived protein 1-like [Palaemon carinicauda]|uniref:tigger transposable element-derived protein 1-like n=1 Tax=Palaemon carinicauda TaxID=392227 RepID=UPI0035B5DF39
MKERLLVFFKSNAKAWVTRTIFIEWINVCLGPAVKNYLQENDLPLKCLLVLDKAPAHPPGLEDIIHPDVSFIKVLYLPPKTTPLLQPMDQQVVANFRKLYTKHLFRRCFKKKLWPPVVAERDFEGFNPSTEDEAIDDPAPEGNVEEIISIGRSMETVVNETEVHNFIEEHSEELTTEDLKELEAMQLTINQEEHSSSGGEDRGGD